MNSKNILQCKLKQFGWSYTFMPEVLPRICFWMTFLRTYIKKIMYLLWAQSVFSSNDECCVVSWQLHVILCSISSFCVFYEKQRCLCHVNPINPAFIHSVFSGIKLYLTWQGGTEARSPGRRLLLCFPNFICAQQSSWRQSGSCMS